MDQSLITLGAVVVVSLASAAAWHFLVPSYGWAIAGSSVTVGLATYFGYPVIRDAAPGALIIVNAVVLGAMIAVGAGIPFKRRRLRQEGKP